ncbi:MarR family transcriptional regulator [Aneurinibacillus sp. Ricciae_BoGa-3]|uniref:MarR family winged helix-turn-helix transcriptional regulator n=1 Tax=Aneurinibacillus sp. Ricciae_BoGa-3 TaxID=3022697 RepID=UPI0023419212|nr:MarR family transcriptional regulator [Aneurinibacillus sp. Ricciae_BoGa-3]WCK56716.1 MarR family transcriptional regulator [Aneurinibacillus sp. Ricciae_BoGa-3]
MQQVQLFLTLYKTNATLVRQLEEKLQPLHLTLGRLCLLVALHDAGGCAIPSELGDDLAVTRANISGLLKALESIDMVRREVDLSNRRRVLVYLTSKGKEVLERAWPIYEETIATALEPLTTEEQSTFLTLLRKLNYF